VHGLTSASITAFWLASSAALHRAEVHSDAAITFTSCADSSEKSISRVSGDGDDDADDDGDKDGDPDRDTELDSDGECDSDDDADADGDMEWEADEDGDAL
jgi:hypothetical protein